MFRSFVGAAGVLALLLAPSVALAQIRLWEDNAPVDPNAPAPEPEESSTTTTTTTTNPDGTTSTTTTTTTSTTTPTATTAAERRPFLDDHRWLDITGFVQPGYIARLENSADGIASGPTDDAFFLQRARLGIRAQLFSWLTARLEFEMVPSFALTDTFVDIAPVQWFTVRVGQFIVPFLQTFRYQEINLGFIDRAIFVPLGADRPFIRFFAPRDIGVQVSGRVGDPSPSNQYPVFEYQLGVFNGRGPNVTLNTDGVYLWAGRLTLYALGLPIGLQQENDLARNHLPRATIAFAGYSNCDDRNNWNRGFTTDVEFRYEGLFVEGSFFWLRNGSSGTLNAVPAGATQTQHGAFFLADSNQCVGITNGTTQPDGTPNTLETVSRGAHLQVQYVLPRFLQDLPFSLMAFEVLFRADWVDQNSPFVASDPLFGGGPGSPGYQQPVDFTEPDNTPTRWRLTFGLNWFPTGQNQIRLGINYQLNREAEDVMDMSGHLFRAINNDIFWLQMTVGLI